MRNTPKQKALGLLEDNLSKRQLNYFNRTDLIPIQSRSGRNFLLRTTSINYNVAEYNKNGTFKKGYCAAPSMSKLGNYFYSLNARTRSLPIFDKVLGTKVILEVQNPLPAFFNRAGGWRHRGVHRWAPKKVYIDFDNLYD